MDRDLRQALAPDLWIVVRQCRLPRRAAVRLAYPRVGVPASRDAVVPRRGLVVRHAPVEQQALGRALEVYEGVRRGANAADEPGDLVDAARGNLSGDVHPLTVCLRHAALEGFPYLNVIVVRKELVQPPVDMVHHHVLVVPGQGLGRRRGRWKREQAGTGLLELIEGRMDRLAHLLLGFQLGSPRQVGFHRRTGAVVSDPLRITEWLHH